MYATKTCERSGIRETALCDHDLQLNSPTVQDRQLKIMVHMRLLNVSSKCTSQKTALMASLKLWPVIMIYKVIFLWFIANISKSSSRQYCL